MTPAPWILTFLIGGAGGVLNAILTGRARLLPAAAVPPSIGRRLMDIGLVGHVLVGGAAAASVQWAMAGTLPVAESGWRAWLPACAGLFVAFVTSRCVTNEVDKAILRRTVCKAAMAPAAHPDTVRTLEAAPPAAAYEIINDLLPRRAGHR